MPFMFVASYWGASRLRNPPPLKNSPVVRLIHVVPCCMIAKNQAVDTLAIQRSLALLEARYLELRESGEEHFLAWEAETAKLRVEFAELRQAKEGLERELVEVIRGKEGLERELSDSREESELLLLQLHQVQEELEHYFLENRRKDQKLHWLRGQRELLRRMLRLQGHVQQRFLALDGRIALPALRRQVMPWWQRHKRS